MEDQNQNLVPISVSNLIKKCRSHEDIKNITRELGKFIYAYKFILRISIPRRKRI